MKDSDLTYYDDLEILMAEDIPRQNASCMDRQFTYYGIQFVYRGTIKLSIDKNAFETAHGPVVFFTYPGVPFSYRCPNPQGFRSQAFVCFNGPRVAEYLRNNLIAIRKNPALMPVRRPNELLEQMRELVVMHRQNRKIYHALCVLKLEEIMLKLAMQDDPGSNTFSKYEKNMIQLSQQIASDPVRDWDFEKEAARLYLSYAHFRHIFKNILGIAPWNYVLECRLHHAAVLIAETNKRISEIAFESGFNDKFYFSRKFQVRYHKSPTEYRKICQGKN